MYFFLVGLGANRNCTWLVPNKDHRLQQLSNETELRTLRRTCAFNSPLCVSPNDAANRCVWKSEMRSGKDVFNPEWWVVLLYTLSRCIRSCCYYTYIIRKIVLITCASCSRPFSNIIAKQRYRIALRQMDYYWRDLPCIVKRRQSTNNLSQYIMCLLFSPLCTCSWNYMKATKGNVLYYYYF